MIHKYSYNIYIYIIIFNYIIINLNKNVEIAYYKNCEAFEHNYFRIYL